MKRIYKKLLVFALIALLSFSSVSWVSAEEAATPVTDKEVSKNAFIFGDANLDLKVNIKDATDIQKVIAKLVDSDKISEPLADVNEDENINVKDATEIQKWLAKLSENDKIGKPLEKEPETAPSTSAMEDTFATAPSTAATADTEPTENITVPTVPTTTATDDQQATTATTEPVESSASTEPTETDATEAQETEPTSSGGEEELYPDPYQKEVVEKFIEQGLNPAEDGMFYSVIYNYYKNATDDEASYDEATPDYVLVWACVGGATDEAYEVIIGDYVLKCPAGCHPYRPGYYIYIPSTDTLMTIEEAYHANLEGLETVFKESGVFRPIEVDFKIVDQQRVSWYGSENTKLILLHHKSAEENVTSKFERGKAPEINIPCDEDGFYYDKIYVVSLSYLGGGNSTQTIDRITVMDGILTVYRTVNKPKIQTADMNYQYVLIELDKSLLESIYDLEDFTVVNVV